MRTPSLSASAFNLSAFIGTIAAGHFIYSRKTFSDRFHIPINRDDERATNLKTHIACKALGILMAHSIPITLGAYVFKSKCASSAHLLCVTAIVHFCILAMQKHKSKLS